MDQEREVTIKQVNLAKSRWRAHTGALSQKGRQTVFLWGDREGRTQE